jgi:uncharacterized Zn-binding protein involved in type VI secretion
MPAAARLSDSAADRSIAISGSCTVFINVNGRRIARIGDAKSDRAVICTGSPNVFAGG